jgi:hypothetical protein
LFIMSDRLSQAELEQVIAEVGQLSLRREAELDRQQVQQILQELNLPPELLDDALVEIRRRQALQSQRRRNRLLVVAVVTVLVGAIATVGLYIQQQQQAIARVQVYESRVTLTADGRGQLGVINRQASPRAYYYVTLQNAPIGQKLSLTCDWIDPRGGVAHQSHYSTRQIDKAVWQTYCYYQFDPSAAVGNWQVKMSVGSRVLSNTSLMVK